jgi:hypothetical protein
MLRMAEQQSGSQLTGGEERSLELVDGASGQTEPERIGLAAEGDLLHIALDMPFGVRTLA